ncbi:MAG: hypothetical protein ACLTYN_16255 [Dysosmobacter welbionis]
MSAKSEALRRAPKAAPGSTPPRRPHVGRWHPHQCPELCDFRQAAAEPQAQNYRADSLYSGSMRVHNAEAYAKQGVEADTSVRTPMEIKAPRTWALLPTMAGEGHIDWANSYGDTYDFETESWTGSGRPALWKRSDHAEL